MLKRTAVAMCAAALCCSMVWLIGCSSPAQGSSQQAQQEEQKAQEASTRIFTDSLGREVEIPTVIDAVAPSGFTAQQVLLTMAPDLLVGMAEQLGDNQLKYFSEGLSQLTVFGAAFVSKGDINKEAVAAAAPQIVIDTGEPKKGLEEDLDNLQTQLGIPVVFISTPLNDYAAAYTMLGDLLGMQERGKELADYCDNAYAEVEAAMAAIPEADRIDVAYLMGDAGLNAIAKGSYQGAIIDLCANNVVVVEKASGSGLGNEINFEQLAIWNPELIVFGANSIHDSVGRSVGRVSRLSRAENYYEGSLRTLDLLNNPPTVNQIMGLQWSRASAILRPLKMTCRRLSLIIIRRSTTNNLTNAGYHSLLNTHNQNSDKASRWAADGLERAV